jgi:hypothetical protein
VLYATDVTAHLTVDDPAARTTDLQNNQAFTLAAAADPQVLKRVPGTDAFLVIGYSLR